MNVAPVSVIIACYKCADTIGRAVASVLNQTVRPAELWLVDDASPDQGRTSEKLSALAKTISGPTKIHVLRSPVNVGPGEARNLAWSRATQPFVAFLDADDSWHEQKIEIQYGWMEAHPNVALTGHQDWVFAGQNIPQHADKSVPSSEVSRELLLRTNVFATRSVMLRADVPNRFPKGKRYSDDYFLWLEIVLGGMRSALINLPLAYQYRPPYSKGGFSDALFRMELGELDNYWRLLHQKKIRPHEFIALSALSIGKYLRRLVVDSQRRIRQSGISIDTST